LLLFLIINYVKVLINKEKSKFIKGSLAYIFLLGAYLILVFVLNGYILKFMESSYAKKDLFSKIIKENGNAKLFLTDKGVSEFHKFLESAQPSDFKMNKSMKGQLVLKIMTPEDIKQEKSEQDSQKIKRKELGANP